MINLEAGTATEVLLPDGRLLYLFVHHCDACTSVDLWTTRSNAVEPDVSRNTSDTRRAPVGLFASRNGTRHTLIDVEPCEGSHGWPAVSTVALVWRDEEER